MPPKNITFLGDTTSEDKKAFEEILMQFEEIVSKVRQLKDSDGVSYYKNSMRSWLNCLRYLMLLIVITKRKSMRF